MRRPTIAAAMLLAFAAGATQACHWTPRRQLPTPIDYPIVRENVKEYHKVGKKQNHPPDWTGGILPAI